MGTRSGLTFRIRYIYKPALAGHALYTERYAPFSLDKDGKNFKMYRSRFKYFGQTGFILLMGLLILILDVGLLINFTQTGQDGRALILVGPLLLIVTILIWIKILTEMNQVTVTKSHIEIKNPFTRRTKKIAKQKTKGFKDIFKNGYTILIIDDSDKVIGKLHDYYYSDFKELRDNLGLNYIERIPTFWDKIIKVES